MEGKPFSRHTIHELNPNWLIKFYNNVITDRPYTEKLSAEQDKKGGTTPLRDAIYLAIQKFTTETQGKITIFTDGLDNCSGCPLSELKKHIERIRNQGILVTFVGSDLDAIQEGGKLGIRRDTCLTVDFNRQKSVSACVDALQDLHIQYRSKTGPPAFTQLQRASSIAPPTPPALERSQTLL